MATSNAQKKATIKYMAENLEEVRFRVPKGKKAVVQQAAQNKGMSVAAYLIDLIEKDCGEKLK
ncbi:hypothetical protein [Agathobaculum sp.]|uniref:hypothetical protein n=1 Tax=Agathobaculum sp. TaxID=2048138 RepID=UPI003A945F46